ncbi:MAG: Bug family tripartite tricarboxylate transporter substrate binding protein [Burkholderiales bacterium]
MNVPLRLILGFSPGSASDQIARAIAPALSQALQRPVEIALNPGNNGADAAAMAAHAQPDGNTLFMATLGTHALALHVNPELPYHPLDDFAPVALVSRAPLVLACHPALGIASVRALVDFARAHPNALTYGTSAIGGAPHLAAELFQHMAAIDLRHVRYDRTERLYEDLEAGGIALSFNNMMSMLPRCAKGSLTALAVTSAQRCAAAGSLPALAETLPGYEVTNWLGLAAPAATPVALLETLSRGVDQALRDPGVADVFRAAGVTPGGGSPQAFAEFIRSEIARWGPVVARFRDSTA